MKRAIGLCALVVCCSAPDDLPYHYRTPLGQRVHADNPVSETRLPELDTAMLDVIACIEAAGKRCRGDWPLVEVRGTGENIDCGWVLAAGCTTRDSIILPGGTFGAATHEYAHWFSCQSGHEDMTRFCGDWLR